VDRYRGHAVEIVNGVFVYSDSGELTAGSKRPCGNCGISDTKDGHDGCLGELPDVMNACCGHGDCKMAYIQYWDNSRISGAVALKEIVRLLK